MPVSDFTIAFLCHSDFELSSRTITQTLQALTANTKETFDTILVLDGIDNLNTNEIEQYSKFARKIGIDEVRLRSRKRNCAHGDPSNNAHFHIISSKTPYLITFESDVVLFKLDANVDILNACKKYFVNNENICIGTKMDDYDSWTWKLEFFNQELATNIKSINRVASHFLIYETNRFLKYVNTNKPIYADIFYDNESSWFNYEDYVSKLFSEPHGPGIAFFSGLPIKIFHCDIKVSKNSVHYTKDIKIKMEMLNTLIEKYNSAT